MQGVVILGKEGSVKIHWKGGSILGPQDSTVLAHKTTLEHDLQAVNVHGRILIKVDLNELRGPLV